MKDHCVLSIICKVLAALNFLVQMISYGFAFATMWMSPGVLLGQLIGSLFWPALLWSLGELLDRQKVQERKMDRILELLGDVEEPEEDLTQLEAQLEEALENGEEPEFEEEDK